MSEKTKAVLSQVLTYRYPQLSAKTGIPENTLRNMVMKKRIPYTKIGRMVLFRDDEIALWLEKNSIKEKV